MSCSSLPHVVPIGPIHNVADKSGNSRYSSFTMFLLLAYSKRSSFFFVRSSAGYVYTSYTLFLSRASTSIGITSGTTSCVKTLVQKYGIDYGHPVSPSILQRWDMKLPSQCCRMPSETVSRDGVCRYLHIDLEDCLPGQQHDLDFLRP